jgi:hypothetical protein
MQLRNRCTCWHLQFHVVFFHRGLTGISPAAYKYAAVACMQLCFMAIVAASGLFNCFQCYEAVKPAVRCSRAVEALLAQHTLERC